VKNALEMWIKCDFFAIDKAMAAALDNGLLWL
jgi:hypothetical protein